MNGSVIEHETGRVLNDMQALSQIPGAMEMLVTEAARGSDKQRPIRLYSMGGPVSYDGGGLAQAAEMTRSGGRGDDEVLVHLSPEEYEAIVAMWGEPEVNPDTGLPEYGFLSKIWKGVKKAVKGIVKSPIFGLVAPIALNMFAPGLGGMIGGALGLGSKAAPIVGNALIRSGVGALGAGKEGAISGALSGLTSGGVGAGIGSKLGLRGATAKIAGDALLGGTTAELAGGDFRRGATGQAMASLIEPGMERGVENLMRGVTGGGGKRGPMGSGVGEFTIPTTEDVPLGDTAGVITGTPTGAPPPVSSANWMDRSLDWIREHPYLTAGGALAAAGIMGSGGRGGGGAPPQLPPEFSQPLPNLSFDRSAMPADDYYTYGQSGGEQSFFRQNTIPQASNTGNSALDRLPGGPTPTGANPSEQPIRVRGGPSGLMQQMMLRQKGWTLDEATGMLYPPGYFGLTGFGPTQQIAASAGGIVRRYRGGGGVRGPGTGRSDDIPALVSDGEYVVDAETVAMLGDGSVDAGARRLDEMRKNLRRHKGAKLAKGEFSDDARTPEAYMAEGGKVKSRSGDAMKSLKELSAKFEKAVATGNRKRVREIIAQINIVSPDTGKKLNDELKLSRGGRVEQVVREVFDKELRGGPSERRARERVGAGERGGRRLTDKEVSEIAQELGGFTRHSRFIRKFRKELKERQKAETGATQ